MNLSTEAKVGSFSVIAFLLLAYMIIHLGSFTIGDKGYQVQAVFSQVNGLKPGNLLRYAGVDVGQVKEILVLPEHVTVTIMVKPGVKIPEGSSFRIGSDGLVGEKHINISPPANSVGFLAPNAVVQGEDIQGLDQLIASSDKMLAEVRQLVKSLNEVMGDEKVKAAMKDTVLNAKEIAANINVMSAALARMAENNEGNINAMIGNLSAMSRTMQDVVGRVDVMLAGVDNNGQTVRDLQETIQNIKISSARVEKMVAALEGVVTDPETAKNLKETLKNVRSVSEKANQMLVKVESISAQAGIDLLYDPHTSKYLSNADIRVNTSPQDFAIIGIAGIGEDNKGNFQIGKGSERFAGRAGVIDSKVGMGIDAAVGKDFKMSVDVYDPNDVRVKLRTQYQLAPETFIVGQTDSINKQADKTTYIGVRQTF